MSTNGKLEPKIYVACLSAYDKGCLHGEWIDANQPTDDLHAAIKAILANSPIKDAEEWEIHAYEDFGGVCLSENEDIEKISEFASFIEEHDELGANVLAHVNGNLEEAQYMIENCYHGEFDDEEAFVYRFLENTEELKFLPEHLQPYFDYQSYARAIYLFLTS